MGAIGVLGKHGVSNSLMLNQHRVAASKKSGGVLRTRQWSDRIKLS